ncbi:MAG: hypothetical protein AB7D43_03220 [Sulfurimonadaceae bacterium]
MDHTKHPLYQEYLNEKNKAGNNPQSQSSTSAQSQPQSNFKGIDYGIEKHPLYAQFKAEKAQSKQTIQNHENSWKNEITPYVPDFAEGFVLGGVNGLSEYGASGAKLLGSDKWQDRFSNVRRFADQQIKKDDSEIGAFIGEMIIDPLNLAPSGLVNVGTKMQRVGKSMLYGAGVGATTMAAKNYGNDDITTDQKVFEMGVGGAFNSLINGVIAGVTKGRVAGIDAGALKNPDGTQKSNEEVFAALKSNPEAFALNPQEADVIVNEIVKEQAKFTQPKFDPQFARETPRPQQPYTPNFQMRPNHPPAVMSKQEALQVILRHVNEQARTKGEAMPYPQAEAKPMMQPQAEATTLSELQSHPRYNELMEMRRNATAKQSQNPQFMTTRGGYRELDGFGGENKHAYDFPHYEKNPNYDFHTTKKDIANLERGQAGDETLWKIKQDLDTLDNHPDWVKRLDDSPVQMSAKDWEEANTVFAKFGDNLAAGVVAGIGEDENGNLTFDPEKFLIGLGGYTAVKAALKNKQVQGRLKEYAQRAVDMVDMNPQVYKENGFNAMVKGGKDGNNFVMNDGIQDNAISAEFNINETVKRLTGVEANRAEADLTRLYEKHPEIFRDEKEVFRLIRDVLNDASHFVQGSGEKNALILANIDGKLGKVGLRRDSIPALVVHALKASKADSELRRLIKRQVEGSPTPSLPTSGTAAHGAKAHSPAYKEIIPQTKEEWNKNITEWHKESHPLTKNEDGSPRVFYHGTGADFSEFKQNNRGLFFVSPSSKWVDDFIGKDGGTSIMPVHIKAFNPFDFDNKKHVMALAQHASLGKLAIDEIKKGNWNRIEDRTTLEAIKKLGFDGVFVKENGTKNLAVFDPTQIKSIHNRGTFDSNNPNILMANGSNALGGSLGGGTVGGMQTAYEDIVEGKERTAEDYLRNIAIGAAAGGAIGRKFGGKAEGTGLFAGARAKGYDAKVQAGKTFDGKYDGMSRFEIDDSKSFLDERKIKNIKENSHNQGANIVNQLEYSKLENGNYEVTLMKQGAKSTKDFIRLELSPDEIKRKFPQDVANKIFNNGGDDVSMLYDKDTRMFGDFDFVLHQNSGTSLSDILNHKELYDNYPELKNMDVAFSDDTRGAFFGSAEHPDGSIKPIIVIGRLPKSDTKSALLHEIQHSIQKTEGFARGGSAQEFYNDAKNKIETLKYELEFEPDDFIRDKMLQKLQKLESEFNGGAKEKAFDMYQKLAGEIEARDVQARMDYTAPKREEVAPYSSENIAPEDAILRFNNANDEIMSGFRQMNQETDDFVGVQKRGLFDNNTDTLERLAKERAEKDWRSISQDGGTLQNVKNTFKELFTDTMSGKYHEARDQVHANMQQKSVKIERLAKVLDDLDEATDKELYRYLTGEANNLPEHVKSIADNMRKTVDDLGAELVRHGVLDEKAYKEWAGVYLHRQYEPHLNPKGHFTKGLKIDKIHERGIGKEFGAGDLKEMTGWLHKQGFLDDNELVKFGSVRDLMAHLHEGGKSGLLREGKLSITQTPSGGIKLRRDFTKAERESMGEIESAKMALPNTLLKLNRMIEHAKFLERANRVDGVVFSPKKAKEFSPQELERAGYYKAEGVQYGALNGKWIRRDVADDIGRTYKDIANAHRDAFRVWNEYHSLWKKSKTVWNPTAHVNNYMGNLFLMHLAGIDGIKLPAILANGVKQMNDYKAFEALELKRLKGTLTGAEESKQYIELKAKTKLIQEAKANGVFGRSQLNDILAGMEQKAVKKGVLSKVDKFAEKAYQFEDDFNRLSFYLTLRQAGKDAKTAKQMIDYMLPDYSKPLPKGWRFMRDSSVAPFISWSYYTMPAIVKMLKTKEGAWNATKVIAMLSGMEYALSQGEITPLDNIPFMDTNKPEDFKGRRFVVNKDGDDYDTLKLDRMIPYAELQNPINYAKSNVSGMLPNALYSMNGMQMYNGRPITYKNKDAGDQSIDWIKHLASQYTPVPAPAMSAINIADKEMRGKERSRTSRTIEPRTLPQSLVQLLGINTLTYDKNALKKEQKD